MYARETVDLGHVHRKKVSLVAKKVCETLAGMEKLAYLCTRKRETGSLNLSGVSLTLAPLAGEAGFSRAEPLTGRHKSVL